MMKKLYFCDSVQTMESACETLFYALEQNAHDFSSRPHVAFLGAQFHPALLGLDQDSLYLQQNFRPFAQELETKGFAVSPAIYDAEIKYDTALVLLPKNAIESRYITAKAISLLKPGGQLMAAAGNKAGGGRIKSMMKGFGLGNRQEVSKNKARAVWAQYSGVDEDAVQKALHEGAVQSILDNKFISQPGIFGWDKIDRGSEILVEHIPEDLKGKGADFGCGYGFLSSKILEKCIKIKGLHCIDADFRAIETCKENLKGFSVQKDYHWADMTKPNVHLNNLDFIVMNPPFHEGKKTESALGRACIKSAAQALKARGELWMVANAHLPYEDILTEHFRTISKRYEGMGFKVFCTKK